MSFVYIESFRVEFLFLESLVEQFNKNVEGKKGEINYT